MFETIPDDCSKLFGNWHLINCYLFVICVLLFVISIKFVVEQRKLYT